MWRTLFCLAALACQRDDDPAAGEGTGPTGPTAPLAPLSDGECPEGPGRSRFSSGGVERKVEVVLPSGDVESPSLIFSFHGLTTPDTDPIALTVDGFDLQALADEMGAIFVVPEARPYEIPLFGTVLLWGILDDAEPDLTLYDDLRTCMAQDHGVDLNRVYSWGHSGGALWTSEVLLSRSDTLAAAVEFSGGADFEVPFLGGPFLPYRTPAQAVPTLLVTGGANDVWPDTTFTLLDFTRATDTLQAGLVADGQTVVRCEHELGHFSFPQEHWELGLDWMTDHVAGEPSPYPGGGRTLPAGCQEAS